MDLVLPAELTTDLLHLSLTSSFDSFVVNFNMNKMESSLEDLVNMLVTYGSTIKKEKSVLYVGSSSGAKNRPLDKGNKCSTHHHKKNLPLKSQAWSLIVAVTPVKSDMTSDICHYYKKSGHRKRNCREYIA
ncbi:uncharacterized protein [Henckelia pumila]|uniref:uncharacterized protein n=1 Tax=Henckelia pumila TaxID=405737 RepID=UPI003C6E8A3B